MSEEAKKFIQNAAWNRFPAEELWIRADNNFWAFAIEDDRIIFTDGIYKDGDIVFHHTIYPTQNGEDHIEPFIETKLTDGYECFAIAL